MRDCIVFSGDEAAGRLFWYPDGLYWRFDAVLTVDEGLWRLMAEDDAGNRLSLGIPQPEGGRMRLRRHFSGTQLRHLGFRPDALRSAGLFPAFEGAFPAHPEGMLPSSGAFSCPDGAVTGRVVCRESPPALLEPFEPGAPLSLAAWYRALTVETRDGNRFAVLPLGKKRVFEE